MTTQRRAPRVTLRQVAERAGLSVSAASLALSKHPRIPEETRRRVREAAAALGYTPNGAARALRSQRQRAIALLMFGPGAEESLGFFSEAVVAVADEALRCDYRVVLVSAGIEAHGERSLETTLVAAGVDGAVCLGTRVTAADIRVMEQLRLPFIFIGKREIEGVRVPYVATDYIGGARLATAHLLALGHTRIGAVVTEAERHLPWVRDRLAGHALAIAEHGLPPEAGPVLAVEADGDAGWDLPAWQATGITALFSTGDNTNGRLLKCLHLTGVRVPEEIAVVGFDDTAYVAHSLPPMTVVRQPLGALGALAARTLLAWLDGAPHEIHAATLSASLVVRQSCGAVRAGNPGRRGGSAPDGTPVRDTILLTTEQEVAAWSRN